MADPSPSQAETQLAVDDVDGDVDMVEPKKRVTQSKRAGLTFPVGRINRKMRQGKYAKLIGKGSAVYLAAVCEYLVAEVLDVAATQAHDNNRQRIKPRHITLAVRNDTELKELLKDVTFPEGGVKPFIHEVLKPRLSPFNSPNKSSRKSSQASSKKSSKESAQKSSSQKSSQKTERSTGSSEYQQSVEL